jgi:hypothetical protein
MDDTGRFAELGGAELSAAEKRSMSDITSLAQRIYVRAVVSTGDLAGVTLGAEKDGDMSLESTRMLHLREASLAFEAASSFYRVQAEWMMRIVNERAPAVAGATPRGPA